MKSIGTHRGIYDYKVNEIIKSLEIQNIFICHVRSGRERLFLFIISP